MRGENFEKHTYEVLLPCNYLLRTPENLNRNTLLVLTLHGYGANPNDMLRLTALAVGADPVIAALQAPFPHYLQRPGQDATVGYNWGTQEHWAQAVQTHHAMLLRVLTELSGRFRIGPERTMLLGFSQPVGLNYRFVATHPGLFRGVVGICGGVARDWEEPKYGLVDSAVLHISRDQDEFYPVETSATFPVKLRHRSADVEYRLLPGGHRFPSTARSILDPWTRRVFGPTTPELEA